MKRLIFIRHGRAEELAPGISDFERSLTLKGKIISRQMALKLKEIEKSPGFMITSPAFRALETAYIFAMEFGIDPEYVKTDSSLYYEMNFRHLHQILVSAGEDHNSVTLFGHNPSFSVIPDSLTKEGCDVLPKSGIICISFNIKEWKGIKQNTGKTEYFIKPEKLQ